MSMKDKGKGIRKNDDYKLVPIRNKFQPLANFPPLSCKTIVTKPPTKPSQDNYFLKFTEHLFLTSYKITPPISSSETLSNEALVIRITLVIIHKNPDNFKNLF